MILNEHAPQVLNDIVKVISQEKIRISENVEGEPRVASLLDEGNIKRFLIGIPELRPYILDQKSRKFGEVIILDYDGKTEYVVNIKTSLGGNDNAFSRLGFVYALTDMEPEEMDKNLRWMKFLELLI